MNHITVLDKDNKEKTVGILNFHYANNYGAVIQAWALYTIFNNLEGLKAVIINYVPKNYKFRIDENDYEAFRMQRDKIERFLKDELGIVSPMIHKVEGNEYDYYCVGSDQVWNVDLPEVAADLEYFFPHLADDSFRFSYAASIGTEPNRINKEIFKKYLSLFNYVSLREKQYEGIISNTIGKNCVCVLDPTLLVT